MKPFLIELLVPSGSSYAADIDAVIELVFWLATFWTVAVFGMFGWLLWRFRAREGVKTQYVTGDEKELKRWVSWPHILILICDIWIVVLAVMVWVNVKQTVPENAEQTVRIVGQQWAWTFVHPGPDGELDTPDDIKTVDEMHLQVDRVYTYELASLDVLHSFSVPIFRLKQDAVPGRVIHGWFQPTITGTYDIQCTEMCGIGHGIMGARLVVEVPEEHEAWVERNAPATVAAVTDAPRAAGTEN
jgi:cytochrome c oxidase subunit 2